MWIGNVTERALKVFVPSWGEINISLLAAVLLVLIVSFFQHTLLDEREGGKSGGRKGELSREFETNKSAFSDFSGHDASSSNGMTQSKEVATRSWDSDFIYMIRLELLAAKNLLAAHLNGTSDPYAIIICGGEKRFSTLVPGTRNPMWGEEFDFYVEDLPVEIKVSIHDWDIVWKSTCLGTTTLLIGDEGQNEAVWYPLDSAAGQVCMQTITKKYPVSASGSLSGFQSTMARRRYTSEKQIGTEVRQKPGPLQTIFDLPPDEVVLHSYSCALERSFLYHGRMFLSNWHICFHSNVFAKQMKVVLPYEDIEEIKRSQHAFINPAITIILRAGSGGHGVPPLASTDGRAKYKFASYWNRNHVFRALQRAAQRFREMKEQAQQEQQQSTLRAQSSSFRHLKEVPTLHSMDELPTPSKEEVNAYVPFLEEEVLTEIVKKELPASVEKVFRVCFADDSKFTEAFRALRKDTELQIESWHRTGQYIGENRKITFRAVCNNPMCPPDSAMTEYQHASFSEDKSILFLETVQQCHDIPFGSYFEVHARWTFERSSDSSCTLVLKVGAHFKKWCFMQGKIKAGTITEVKGGSKLIIDVMMKFLEEANAAERNSTSDNASAGEQTKDAEVGATPAVVTSQL
ncbi:hypothetical protein R1flu_019702 [Riccia fluitans]|uniref:BAG-associated GRAM protein 1 n=1 Tax=Riccia fluitans TaxID=41844 RepID=A0ABD1ZN87_9MARC